MERPTRTTQVANRGGFGFGHYQKNGSTSFQSDSRSTQSRKSNVNDNKYGNSEFGEIQNIPNEKAKNIKERKDLKLFTVESFVRDFNNGECFFIKDSNDMGIDIDDEEEIAPKIYNILSDSPLAKDTHCKIPESYTQIPDMDPGEKISVFPDSVLFFMFYAEEPNEENREFVSQELGKRGYVFDPQKNIWTYNTGSHWDINVWGKSE